MSIGRARFFSSGKKRKPQTAFVKNSQSARPFCAFCALFYLITFFAALQSFCKNSAQGIFAAAIKGARPRLRARGKRRGIKKRRGARQTARRSFCLRRRRSRRKGFAAGHIPPQGFCSGAPLIPWAAFFLSSANRSRYSRSNSGDKGRARLTAAVNEDSRFPF